ncbi:MAG: hypothetical protein WKF37_17900, partial [Bryobacteraceae bacterium]
MKTLRRGLLTFLTLLLASSLPLPAQQTIFDVPSADVSDRRDWFYQHQTVSSAGAGSKRWVQTNSFGYGVGRNSELDVTVFDLDYESPSEALGGFGWKTSLPVGGEDSKYKSRLVIGDMVQVGSSEEGARRTGNWAYVLWSTEFARTKTRLTGGGFHGTAALFGNNVFNFLGGIEQPV